MSIGVHGSPIPDDSQFRLEREANRNSQALDTGLRQAAVDLQLRADRHGYTYSFEWCGVPVIRLPDDIIVFQEMIWEERPSFVIETGVARGGGLVLSASLMEMAGLSPRVLGIDIQILPHARLAIEASRFSPAIELVEADSVGPDAVMAVQRLIEAAGATSGLMILDSNHTHEHVLAELRALAGLLPVGSLIVVADTLVEEMPEGTYPGRPWDKGNNPMTAVSQFLEETQDFQRSLDWGRRGLLTENRDGVLIKLA
jgi:cephalosporin hydroxylase